MHRRNPAVVALVLALFSVCVAAGAEVRLAGVFSDNMVLQRDMPVPVWGWAEPGEKVLVTFGEQSAEGEADADGRWQVTLEPLPASDQPAELVAEGGNTVRARNVLVGEVWVCSGQSNMQWNVANSNDAEAEIADAGNYPAIRLLTVPNVTSDEPLPDITASWAVCDSRSVFGFSAVGYFFGRDLHKHLDVPIGLIDSSWGGTPAEAWTSREALDRVSFLKAAAQWWDRRIAEFDPAEAEKKYQSELALWRGAVKRAERRGQEPPRKPVRPGPAGSPHRPASLYNGMIAPLIPFAVRGAIWYQGESNASRAWQYRTLLPTMIRDWRTRWGQGDLPFLFVQLANFRAEQTEPAQADSRWAFLREAQLLTLSLPETAMAVAIDIGEADDIHPRNKQEVGRRLALAARALAYEESLVYSGPIYQRGSMTVRDGKAVLRFDHVGGGLVAHGDALKGFAVAGEDRDWVWAEARIEGEQVVVWSDEVPSPAAVRYGWANNPIGNLYNAEGLPASPFRTDDWPGDDGPRE